MTISTMTPRSMRNNFFADAMNHEPPGDFPMFSPCLRIDYVPFVSPFNLCNKNQIMWSVSLSCTSEIRITDHLFVECDKAQVATEITRELNTYYCLDTLMICLKLMIPRIMYGPPLFDITVTQNIHYSSARIKLSNIIQSLPWLIKTPQDQSTR